MSDTNGGPSAPQFAACFPGTMQEMIDALMGGGLTHAASRRLAQNAIQEIAMVAQMIQQDRAQAIAAAEERGYKRGSEDSARIAELIKHSAPLTLKPLGMPDFTDPNSEAAPQAPAA